MNESEESKGVFDMRRGKRRRFTPQNWTEKYTRRFSIQSVKADVPHRLIRRRSLRPPAELCLDLACASILLVRSDVSRSRPINTLPAHSHEPRETDDDMEVSGGRSVFSSRRSTTDSGSGRMRQPVGGSRLCECCCCCTAENRRRWNEQAVQAPRKCASIFRVS